jgi:hypothetical protein
MRKLSEEVRNYRAMLRHAEEILYEIENNTRQLREKIITELMEMAEREKSDEAR